MYNAFIALKNLRCILFCWGGFYKWTLDLVCSQGIPSDNMLKFDVMI